MKKFNFIIAAICLVCACSKGFVEDIDPTEKREEYNAIVTVKQTPGGRIFFQLDDNNVLYPTNYSEPYTGMRRIICGISTRRGSNECLVEWMDFLVKGDISYADDAIDDGLDILDDWITSVEDGFLTIHYSAWWGDGTVPHLFLVKPSGNAYELTVVHQMNGDEPLEKGDGIIYFDLDGILPDTEGAYKDLAVNWKTCDAKSESKTYRYRTRQ